MSNATLKDGAEQQGQLLKLSRNQPVLLVFLGCLSFEILLVLLDLTVNWHRWSDSGAIRRLFNITREDGLASLFAIIQTFVVAIVVWLIYGLNRHRADTRKQSFGWLVLALFFSYMVIDDGAMVHERIGTAFKQANEGIVLPSYGWQIIIAPIFVAMGLYMAWFFWQERHHPVRRDWLLAALICLATAVLLDFIEGMKDGYQPLVSAFGWSTKTIAHFSKSIEEFLEMLGMSFFLIFFLNYLSSLTEQFEIIFKHKRLIIRDINSNQA